MILVLFYLMLILVLCLMLYLLFEMMLKDAFESRVRIIIYQNFNSRHGI